MQFDLRQQYEISPMRDQIPFEEFERRWNSEEPPQQEGGVLNTIGALGSSFAEGVEQVAPAFARGLRGSDIPHPSERGLMDNYIIKSRQDAVQHMQQFEGQGVAEDIAQTPESLGFSGAAGITGLVAGGAGLLASGGNPVAAGAAGGVASGATAYRIAKDMFMEETLNQFNEDSLQDRGYGLSKEEWENAKANLESLATEHGLWEALPEAIGNVAGAGIIFAPAKKVLGEKLASNVVARVMGKGTQLFGTEIATEAVTQQGQHNLAVDSGLQEGEHRDLADFGESVKEVASQTILQTAMMGGLGSSVKGLSKLGAKKGLSKPLSAEEPVFDPNKPTDLTGGNAENTPQLVLPTREEQGETSPYPVPVETELFKKDRDVIEMPYTGSNSVIAQTSGYEPIQMAGLQMQAPALPVGGGTIVADGEVAYEQPVRTPSDFNGYEPSGPTIEQPAARGLTPLPEGQGNTPPVPWVGGKLGLSYTPKSSKEIAAVAHEAAESPKNGLTKPTEAQKEAGNYKLGHVKIGSFDISIENPHGSKRTGTDPDGKKWSQKMHGHYGYIKGTMGKDKDHMDVFIKNGVSEEQVLSKPIYVVEQVNSQTGEFDEHKIIMGASSGKEAHDLYHANYEKGWRGYGDMKVFATDEFKGWVDEQSAMYKQDYAVQEKQAEPEPVVHTTEEQSAPESKTVEPVAAIPAKAPAPKQNIAPAPEPVAKTAAKLPVETPKQARVVTSPAQGEKAQESDKEAAGAPEASPASKPANQDKKDTDNFKAVDVKPEEKKAEPSVKSKPESPVTEPAAKEAELEGKQNPTETKLEKAVSSPETKKELSKPSVHPEEEVAPSPEEEEPKSDLAFSPDDLPYQTAYDAHRGTSFDPEKRAKQEQAGYVEHVQNLYDYLLKAAGKNKQAEVVVEMEQYKEKFLSKRLDVLRSRSRVLSTMITGPANFNTSRNEKASRSYENKAKALWEWQDKAQKGMHKRLGLTAASQAIRSDDVNATTKLKDKIKELESLQEQMKLGNKEYKRTDGDIDAMDVSDSLKEKLREWKKNVRAPYDGKPYQNFTLRNNNANIKRYEQRLKSVEREQAVPTEEIAFDGGTYIDNADEGRVQLVFDEKPDADTRAQLKSAGFRWAPSKGAWQRQRSEGARYKAKEIAGLLPGSQAMSLAPKEQPVSGTTTSQVLAAINELPDMPNALDVTVVQSERDLPVFLKENINSSGTSGVRGVYDPVTEQVYLVADNLTSAEEAKAIWMHEQVGHHGLRGIMDVTERAQLLNQVALVAGKDLQPVAQRYGLDLNDKAQRQQAAEEYLAQAAEKLTLDESLTAKAKRAWAKLVTVMQKVLSKLGIVNAPNTLIEDVLANSVHYLKGLSDQRVLAHDGQRYSLVPQAVMYHPRLGRVRDLFNIDLESTEIRDNIDSGDMTAMQAAFGLPHWTAKLYKGFKKIYDVQLTRSERRSRMFQESVDGAKTLMNGKLSKEQEKELTDFVWKWDGKQIEALSEHEKIVLQDDEVIVNPDWVEDYEKWLSRRRLSPEVKKAMLELRTSLDADFIRAYNAMNRIDGINKSDLEAYLSEMGQQHNYFPHHRYGEYYIQGRRETEKGKWETVYRTHFDAKTDDFARGKAQDIASGLKEKYHDLDWTMGKNEQLSPDVFGAPVDPQAMTQIIAAAADRIGDSDHAKEVQKQLSKAVSDVIKTRGWAAHSIKRQGIEGFEKENLRRVLYDYKQGLTGWISKMEASSDFTKALGDIDAKKHPREYSYASTYVEDMMRSVDKIDQATGRIKGIAFAWYLGANVKTAALNLTQNIITGVPRLSMHIDGGTGFWKAAMETLVGQVSGKNTMADDEQQLLRELYDEDVITEGYLNEIRGKLKDSHLEKGWQKFVQVLGMPMAVAERFNRASLALAAYRAARAGKVKGQGAMDYDAAKKFADQIVRDAHFVYGKTNQPQAIRHSKAGRAVSPVYTFRTFSHNLLLLWNQMARHEGKEGKIALAKSIGATAALGGVTAVPMYATAMAITQLVSGSDDDWTEKIRGALPQSDLMRDMAIYGLPAGLGVNLGGSLGVEMPIAPRITAQSTPQTAIADNLGDILGIPWDLFVKKPTRIMTALENENELRAVEEALPTVLKNIMQAYRLWNEGQTSLKGTPIEGERLTAIEAFGKSIGFQPVKSTKSWQQYAATRRSMAIRTERANKIAARIVEAIKDKDYAAQKAAQAEWQAWNEKAQQDNKPWLIVTGEDIKRRLKGRMKAKRPSKRAMMRKDAMRDVY